MNISLSAILLAATFALPAWGAGSTDAGRQVFPVCQSCHTDPVTAQRFQPYKFDPAALAAAFQRQPQMNRYLSLGTETINDLTYYMGLPDRTDTDRLLDWGEDTFPELMSPRRQVTGQQQGYTYRFYPDTGVYVGTKDGIAWIYRSRLPNATIDRLGSMRIFLDQMPNGR